MRVALDSNVYSLLFRGHPIVAEIVRRSQEVVLSAVVIGELLYGYRFGSRMASNLRELDDFLANPHVTLATVNRTTADRYSRIATALRAKGRPIPTNDIWIAAHAMERRSLQARRWSGLGPRFGMSQHRHSVT